MSLHPDIERIALLGWRCVPAWPSKKGGFKGYLQAATYDLDQLERWSHEFQGCNWKVVPAGSGVWALDVDVPGEDHANDGVAALRDLCARHGPLPPRPHGRSGSGGHLMVFRDDGRPMLRGSERPQKGMDTCAATVAFTISPSRSKRGQPYRWQVAPWDVAPPLAPEWLLKLLAPPPPKPRPERPEIITEDRARRVLARAVDEVIKAGPGGRNAALNRAAFTAGGLAGADMLTEQEAVFALYTAGRHIGLDDGECRATIRSGFRAGTLNPLDRKP